MNWVTMVLGLILILAPFLSGFSGQPGPLWLSLIGGAVIAILGALKQYKWATGAGLIIFVSPWLLSFAGTPAGAWSWAIGAVTALLAGYMGFVAEPRERSGGTQQRHA